MKARPGSSLGAAYGHIQGARNGTTLYESSSGNQSGSHSISQRKHGEFDWTWIRF